MTVTDGKIPKWRAVDVRSGSGPLKVTVKRLPPTDDSIFYSVTLAGFLTYATPVGAQD